MAWGVCPATYKQKTHLSLLALADLSVSWVVFDYKV